MRITKHEHAFLTVEEGGETLVIDPGSFTHDLGALTNVVGVVVTHEHADHWSVEHLEAIHRQFPHARMYTTPAVAAGSPVPMTVVSPGDRVMAGSFSLHFFGGTHNEIHSSLPLVDNVGVYVNDRLYYPGDSYAIPAGEDVEILAAPAGAPWLKIGEAMDFVLAIAPRHAFGTHELTLSPAGIGMHFARLAWATAQGDGTFHELSAGDSFEV